MNSLGSILITPARYVLIPVAHVVTGYSRKAIERKIERGDWQENKVWLRAPDGHICIDLHGYCKWVESGHWDTRPSPPPMRQPRSHLHTSSHHDG